MNFKTPDKLVIGLSGSMLCGKSAALAAFKKCGAFTLSCDELVKEISGRPAVRRKIGALLGAVEKEALAAKIFSDVSARKKLEGLLHPLVLKEVSRRLKADKSPVRVVEVPLLFEAGLDEAFDLTVVVAAPDNALAARAKKRGIKRTDFLKRRKAQLPQEKKISRADICLLNAAAPADLEGKVKGLYRAVTKIYKAK